MYAPTYTWGREPDRELEPLQKRLPWRICFGDVNRVNQNINSGRSHIYKPKCVQSDSQLVNLPVTPDVSLLLKHRERFASPAQAEHIRTQMRTAWYCSLWLGNLPCHRLGLCQTFVLIPWILTAKYLTYSKVALHHILKNNTPTMCWEFQDE